MSIVYFQLHCMLAAHAKVEHDYLSQRTQWLPGIKEFATENHKISDFLYGRNGVFQKCIWCAIKHQKDKLVSIVSTELQNLCKITLNIHSKIHQLVAKSNNSIIVFYGLRKKF